MSVVTLMRRSVLLATNTSKDGIVASSVIVKWCHWLANVATFTLIQLLLLLFACECGVWCCLCSMATIAHLCKTASQLRETHHLLMAFPCLHFTRDSVSQNAVTRSWQTLTAECDCGFCCCTPFAHTINQELEKINQPLQPTTNHQQLDTSNTLLAYC